MTEERTTLESHLKTPRSSSAMTSSYVTVGGSCRILEPQRIFLLENVKQGVRTRRYMHTLGQKGGTVEGRKSSAVAMTKGRRTCGVVPTALGTVQNGLQTDANT